jgi:hypothetical protein
MNNIAATDNPDPTPLELRQPVGGEVLQHPAAAEAEIKTVTLLSCGHEITYTHDAQGRLKTADIAGRNRKGRSVHMDFNVNSGGMTCLEVRDDGQHLDECASKLLNEALDVIRLEDLLLGRRKNRTPEVALEKELTALMKSRKAGYLGL